MADAAGSPSFKPIEGGGGPKWHETTNGAPKASYRNAKVALTCIGAVFSFNLFSQRGYVSWHLFGPEPIEISDRAMTSLRDAISNRYDFDPSEKHLRDAACALAEQGQFDPVLTYLNGLRWDGKLRINTWLSRYLGAVDTPYVQEVGRKVLVAGVRRARQPGCKFDHVMVLEGAQRAGKSTALNYLAGGTPDLVSPYFTDQDLLGATPQQQQEGLAGRWIVELSELHGLHQSAVEKVKSFISRQHERGRGAYGHFVVDQPRRCIMIGTTNASEYLTDSTGNTRFWPITCMASVDLQGILDDRDQLWAEAAAAEATGEPLIIDRELWADAAEQQRKRLTSHPWDDVLDGVKGKREFGPDGEIECVLSSVILASTLEIAKERQTRAVFDQVARSMKKNGWRGPELMRVGTDRGKGYWRFVTDAMKMGDKNGF